MENAVTRLYDGVHGRDWVSNLWDDFVAIHAEDVVVEARTATGERYQMRGRDACMAEARSLSDVGLRHTRVEPVAVRGERLAVLRWVSWTEETDLGGGPMLVEEISVVETDVAGKVAVVVLFEPEHLARALAELDRRAEALGAES